MASGWIKLYRQIQDCCIWQTNEPFDKRSAWIDLLLSANHSDKRIVFNGNVVIIKRGQYLTSIRKLAEHWSWSLSKTFRFIKLLEEEHMLKKESDKERTLLTIENYAIYQGIPDVGNTNSETPMEHSKNADEYTCETPMEHSRNTDGTQSGNKQEYKEYKNERMEEDNNKYITVSNDTVCQTETVKRIVEKWNELSTYGISPVERISTSSKRGKSLNARLREYGEEKVIQAIEYIKTSDFLQGKNYKGWSITFDWFVKPSNFPKVLERNYDNRTSNNSYQNKTAEMLQDSYAMMAEWLNESEENGNAEKRISESGSGN